MLRMAGKYSAVIVICFSSKYFYVSLLNSTSFLSIVTPIFRRYKKEVALTIWIQIALIALIFLKARMPFLTAKSSRIFIWSFFFSTDHFPSVSIPMHLAPQPSSEVSVCITVWGLVWIRYLHWNIIGFLSIITISPFLEFELQELLVCSMTEELVIVLAEKLMPPSLNIFFTIHVKNFPLSLLLMKDLNTRLFVVVLWLFLKVYYKSQMLKEDYCASCN